MTSDQYLARSGWWALLGTAASFALDPTAGVVAGVMAANVWFYAFKSGQTSAEGDQK